MPASLSRINDVILRTDLTVGDETIEIEYRIGALGADFDDWFLSEGHKRHSLYTAVERAVSYVGILDADGNAIPPTAAALRSAKIPPQILQAILTKVRQEVWAGKVTGSQSAGALRPVAT